MYFCLLFLIVLVVPRSQCINPLMNCEPKIQYVEVDEYYRFTPYIVALHRCTGKTTGSSPATKCVAKTYENVTFHVDDLVNRVQPLKSLKNHTSCHEQCKYDSSVCNKHQTWQPSDCSCRCNVVGKKQCEEGLYWDSLHCACRCPKKKEEVNCGQYRVFSEEVCGCVCKPRREGRCNRKNLFLHPETCECVPLPVNTGAQEAVRCNDDNGVISKVGVVVVAVVEAFLIIAGYIFWMKYLSGKDLCRRGNKESPYDDITIDTHSIDTPTIEVTPGLSVVYPKKHNNNTTKTSSSSYDALLKERSAENLYDGSSESLGDWKVECGSMTKV